MSSLGESIKKLRKSNTMTQAEFADSIGISRSYLGDLENNRKSPSFDTLQKIADYLQIPVTNLVGDTSILVSVDTYLSKKLNIYINEKSEVIYREIKLLTDSVFEIPGQLFGFRKGTEAVEDYEKHYNRIEKLEKYGENYIKHNFSDYTYENFRLDFPNSNFNSFQEYKDSEWNVLKEILDNLLETYDISTQGNIESWINKRFSNQVKDSLEKILVKSSHKDKEEYYINELVQPILDEAAEKINNIDVNENNSQ